MKKLITTVALTLSFMLIGVTVYAACNPGSLKSGNPGTCTYEEPSYLMNGSEFEWDEFGLEKEIIIGYWSPGEAWCDLNIIGTSCWITVYPE